MKKKKEEALRELEEIRKCKILERVEDREIITEKGDGTEIIRYNEYLKEITWRDIESKETVSFERIDERERERLDELYDKIEYYSQLNEENEVEDSMNTKQGSNNQYPEGYHTINDTTILVSGKIAVDIENVYMFKTDFLPTEKDEKWDDVNFEYDDGFDEQKALNSLDEAREDIERDEDTLER
jgi:hypothetical protein